MLLDIAIVSLIVGWLLRGRLSNLAEVEIHGLLLALLVVGVQLGGQYAEKAGWFSMDVWGPFVYAAAFVLLATAMWLNRRSPAFFLIGVGLLLNLAVVAANGGKMPVSADGLVRAGFANYVQPLKAERVVTHRLMDEGTRLPFLASTHVLTKPYPLPKVFSLGDAILAIGALWFIVGGMLAHPTVTGRPRALEVRRLAPFV